MTTTVPANTGDRDNKAVEPLILFNVHSSKYVHGSKYSITPRLVETQHPTGFNWLKPVSYTTGLNRLGYNNRTDLNRLYVVQSGFSKLRVQSEPVAVAVAPDQGPKTGLNQTFKHYSPRAGSATFYASLGLSEDIIQALGWWSSQTWKIYIRDNPTVRAERQLAAIGLRLRCR